MRDFKMPSEENATISNVVILVRVSKAYSDKDCSINIFVDPWYLVDNNLMTFSRNIYNRRRNMHRWMKLRPYKL